MLYAFIQNLDPQKREILVIGFAFSYFVSSRNRADYIKALMTYLELDNIKEIEIYFESETTIVNLLSKFLLQKIVHGLIDPQKFMNEVKNNIDNKKYYEFLNFLFCSKLIPIKPDKISIYNWHENTKAYFLKKIEIEKNKKLIHYHLFNSISCFLKENFSDMEDLFKGLKSHRIFFNIKRKENNEFSFLFFRFTIFIFCFISLFAFLMMVRQCMLNFNLKFSEERKIQLISILFNSLFSFFSSFYFSRNMDPIFVYKKTINECKISIKSEIDSILNAIEIFKIDVEKPILKVLVSDSIIEKKVEKKESVLESSEEEDKYKTNLMSMNYSSSQKKQKEKKKNKNFEEIKKQDQKSANLLNKNNSLFFTHYQQQDGKQEQISAVWHIGEQTYSESHPAIRPVMNGKNQYICLPQKIAQEIEQKYPQQIDALKRLIGNISFIGAKNQNGLHFSWINYVNLSNNSHDEKSSKKEQSIIGSQGKKVEKEPSFDQTKELVTLSTKMNIKYIADNFDDRIWCIMLYSECKKKVLYFPIFISNHNTANKSFTIDLNQYQELVDFQEYTSTFKMSA